MAYERPHWLHWVPHPQIPEGGEDYDRRWFASGVISLSILIYALDATILGVATPALARDLGASSSEIQWAFAAYTVAVAGFVLIGGGLADRFGRKGVFQLGLVVFMAGSIAASFAADPTQLILARALAGAGAALLLPPALSLIGVMFKETERARAIGLWASFGALGLALGPIVGGLLLREFWFGSIFLVNVPVCLIALALSAYVLPKSRRPGQVPLDVVGAALSLAGLGGLVFAVIEAPNVGWTHPGIIAGLVVGVVAAVAFVLWELRIPGPLFDLRVFTLPGVIAGALAMGIIYVTFNGVQLLIPQYLQFVELESPLTAGLVLLSLGAVFAVLSPSSAPIVERYGIKHTLIGTTGLMTIGMALLALVDVWGGTVNVVVGLVVYALGFSFIVAPATNAIMAALPASKAGDGSAVNQVSRQTGGALGIAVLGSIASFVYRAELSLDGLGLTSSQISDVEDSLSGALTIGDEVGGATGEAVDAIADAALTIGVQWAMLVAAGLTLAVGIVGGIILTRAERKTPDDGAVTPSG